MGESAISRAGVYVTVEQRTDLEIYQNKELESTFVEIINKKSSNEIVVK